jgi:3-hydroxyisobutyrate dehydrogenase
MGEPLPAVGCIGLGDMGGPMAARILERGFPTTVCDLRRDAVAPLVEQGALAADPEQLAATVDVVVVCVVDGVQVAELVRDRLAGALRRGSTVVITSSVLPRVVQDAAALLARHGVDVLDAPVSGSRPAVAAGTLTVMAGGPEDVLRRVAPVLDCFANRVVHVGGHGAGQTMKIANNLMLHLNHLVALEAVRFARSEGLDERMLIDVVNSGTGRSWVTETWGLMDAMLSDHPQAGGPGIHDMFTKEMWNAALLARASHTALPLTGLGVQVAPELYRERERVLGPDS